jgi:hypothetical protein
VSLPPFQQWLLSVGLAGLGIYFAVQLCRGLLAYRRYVRLSSTAIVTWPAPRPPLAAWLLALGVLGAATAVVNAWMRRPLHHVLGLALMAAYFLVMVPLALRMRQGVYRDGVWADRGFLAWGEVARIAFVETPRIVLLLQPRRGGASFRLSVPPDEYGTVRKLLDEKARDGALQLEPAILGR